MAGGNKSKNKGSGAERELCKYLSDLFGGSFIRSNNSGAYIGGKNIFRKAALSENQVTNLKADIVPPDFMPRLVLESKFYKDFRFHQLMQPGPTPVLDAWIKQCIDIIDEKDFWLIGFKINLRGWFVAVPETFTPHLVFQNYCHYESQYGIVRVTELKSFFEVNRASILNLSA